MTQTSLPPKQSSPTLFFKPKEDNDSLEASGFNNKSHLKT